MVRWDNASNEYVSAIAPGATLAEGSATLEALPAGAPGKGKLLVLEGGVSDTPEGGLTVPHREEWQSLGGIPSSRQTGFMTASLKAMIAWVCA